MNKITWTCELCDTKNTDLRSETAIPMCGGCDKSFDWEDVVHVSDDLTAYLNQIDTKSMVLYNKAACDLVEEPDAAVHILQDAFNGNVKVDDALRLVRLKQGQELWRKLGEVPVNEFDELDQPFLHFEAGVPKQNVWHWFERAFDCSIVNDLIRMQPF